MQVAQRIRSPCTTYDFPSPLCGAILNLQTGISYRNCLRKRKNSTQTLNVHKNKHTPAAICRPVRLVKHNKNKTKNSTSAAKLRKQTS